MARPHLYLPVATAAGDVLENIVVRLLEPGTTTQITDSIYSGPSGSSTYTQPFTVASGVLDFYLAAPRRARIGITPPGQAEFFLEDIDIYADAALIVTTPTAMRVTNSPPAGGYALVALDANTAHWATVTAAVARATATHTTASLASGATEQSTITIATAYRLLQIQTTADARVRLYTTAASQTADLSRIAGVDPNPGAGVVLDYVTDTTVGVSTPADLSPVVEGASTESTPVDAIPITVTSNAVGTGPITVTFVYAATE